MGIKLKYKPSAFACSLLLLALVACRKEKLRPEDNDAGDKIAFSISDGYEPMTKGGGEVRNIEMEVGGETLSLALVVEDNDETATINGTPQTRGSAYDNGSHPISSIDVSAIIEEGNGGKSYFRNETVGITSGKGVSDRFWPDQALSFFAYAVSKDNVTVIPSFTREDGLCKGNFAYALPDAAPSGTKNDATNQPDIVFAIAPDQFQTMNSGEVSLVFHHALSALLFKVGNMPENTYLESIAIDGVYSSGTCYMLYDETNGIDFNWLFTEDQVQDAIYQEEMFQAAVNGEQMGGEEAIFMMLPQTMGDETKLVLSFKIEGNSYELEKPFKDFIDLWEADKKYCFTIGVPSHMDIEVEDKVVENQTKKQELEIRNTGLAPSYIRATLVGYWVTTGVADEDIIVGQWRQANVNETDSSDDGVFEMSTDFDANWFVGSDGFYYYRHIVPSGAATTKLFESYSLNGNPPVVGAELVLTVAAQIVKASEIGQIGWPVELDSDGKTLQQKL